jgi:methyl-accepting chemotaxis protein
MRKAYDSLKGEINDSFFQIVGIINEIIEQRTDSFSSVLDLSEKIQKGSEEFVGETDQIVKGISSEINHKIDNLNMDKMKQDIEEATSTFLSITEELELLSYNTICRTMALGEKGATITHISKEIKKYSTSVKDLLDAISKEFQNMFNTFKYIADHIVNTKLTEEGAFNVDVIDDFGINSDVSILIENSQFHDIFVQEMDIIQEALGDMKYSSPYEAGKIFGVFEKAISKLDIIKYDLQGKLEEIQHVLKDFLYTFNTDLQNIASKTNILRSELNKVHEVSAEICTSIGHMRKKAEETSGVVRKTKQSVDLLEKQSKTFRNLVVITAVEVARINDESLRSVVVSMTNTEKELHELIDKLHDNIGKWQELREDFVSTFASADKDMNHICHSSVAEGRKEMLGDTVQLDKKLDGFRDVFVADKYVKFFDSNTDTLLNLFAEYVEGMQESFNKFNEGLTEEILSSEDFTNGRNDAELKDILASDDDQSSIEFF